MQQLSSKRLSFLATNGIEGPAVAFKGSQGGILRSSLAYPNIKRHFSVTILGC